MSLSAVYVKCADGLCYQSLVYQDVANKWFICFDDDEPPELVIKFQQGKGPFVDPRKVLKKLGIPYDNFRKSIDSERQFRGKFHAARSYFFEWMDLAPAPRESDTHEGAYKRQDLTGSFVLIGGRW